MKWLIPFTIICCLSVCAGADNITLKYSDMESNSLKASNRLKALGFDLEAAKYKQKSQLALLYPRLVLDGFYKYNAVVPEIEFQAPVPSVKKLGDNPNYSIGPSISWVVWDNGVLKDVYKSFDANTKAKQLEIEGVTRQINLALAKAYFQVVSAREQFMQINDAYQLSLKQYNDIVLNVKAGAKSRKDELQSHAELLARTRQLAQVKADFCTSLRELGYVAGVELKESSYLPVGIQLEDNAVLVEIDTADILLEKFKIHENSVLWENHPDILVFDEMIESLKLAQSSSMSGLWPKISVSARSSFDYPNGPKLESFNQNSVGINFSMPVFEAGTSRSKAGEYENNSKSANEKKMQKNKELVEIWYQTKDQIKSLNKQYEINEQLIKEADELAKIVYKSYTAGSATYIEVENSNYRILEARIAQSKTKVQLLMQYAVLRSLSK